MQKIDRRKQAFDFEDFPYLIIRTNTDFLMYLLLAIVHSIKQNCVT